MSSPGPAPRRGGRRSDDARPGPGAQPELPFAVRVEPAPPASLRQEEPAEGAAWRLICELRARLAARGDAVVVRDDRGQVRSGRDVVRDADAVAAALAAADIGPGAVVAAWLPRDADLLAAMLGTLQRGACWLPLDVRWPMARVQATLVRGTARVCLVRGRRPHGDVPCIELAAATPTSAAQAEALIAATLPTLSDHASSFAISTSGTTGTPKIAANTWTGLANVVRAWVTTPGLGPGRVQAALSSPAFDMSVLQWLCPPLVDASIAALGDDALFDPAAAARALQAMAVTDLLLPPSTWRLLRRAGYVPGPKTVVTFGGEALDEATVADATARCAAVWNGWGVSEAAACTTLARVDRGELPPSVGWPLPGCRVWAIDDDGRPVPPGRVGELAIAGVGVGRGDLRDGEDGRWRLLTGDAAGVRAYRCGDHGRVEADGSVTFLGRRDGQLKLRGLRVQAEEIEALLRQHGDVRDSAVDVRERADGPELCAWVVGADAAALPALRTLLAERLPAALIPSTWRWVAQLPLGASGKVDRRALTLDDGVATATDATATDATATDATATALAAAMASVLGLPRMATDADFFALGGDSLAVARLRSRVEAAFGHDLPPLALWSASSPRALADVLRGGSTPGHGTVANNDDSAPHDLTRLAPPWRDSADAASAPMLASQRGVWLQARQRGHDVGLCVVARVELEGALDADALVRAWEAVAARNDGLRARFGLHDGEARLQLQPRAAMPWRRLSIEGQPLQRHEATLAALTERALAAPFDLDAAPPWRSLLVRRGREQTTWLLLAHHVALDGGSLEPLLDAVAAALAGEGAGEGAVESRATAASLWTLGHLEAQRRTGASAAAQRTWWRTQLAQLHQPAPLPAALVASEAGETDGVVIGPARCATTIEAATWRAALRAGASVRATPLMVLVGAVSRWLAARCATTQPVLATVLPGRELPGSAQTIGQLATTLPLLPRHIPRGGLRDACVAGRDALLEAMAHPDVGIDELVAMAPAGAAALLRCCVLLQPPAPAPRQAAGLRLTLLPQPALGAPFDLGVEAFGEDDGALRLVVTSRLPDAAARLPALVDDLAAFVAAAAADPDAADCGTPTTTARRDFAAVACWQASWPRVPPADAASTPGDAAATVPPLSGAGAPRVAAPDATGSADVEPAPARLVGDDLAPALAALDLGPGRGLRDLLDRAAESRAPIDVVERDGRARRRDANTLREQATQLAGRLPGRAAVGVRADDPWQLLVGLWACWLGGRLAVPLALDLDADAVGHALRLAGADVLLLQRDDAAGLLGAATAAGATCTPLDGDADAAREPRPALVPGPAAATECADDAPCLGLLTSGSTGAPKLVLHGARSLLAQIAAWGAHQGFGGDDVFANWLPLDHVAALCMFHLQPLAQRAAQHHAGPTWVLAEPTRWLDLVADNAASVTWAPNFGLELLLGALAERDVRRWDLRSLRAVLLGGEAIVPATARRFAEAVARAGAAADCLVPGWGMSETASATFTRPRTTAEDARAAEAVGALPLGRPVPGFAVQIVDEADVVLPCGVPGRLWVRGPMLRQRVLGAAADAGGEFGPIADGAWLDTGDRALISAAGDVHVLGRDDETVRIHGVARDALALEHAAVATGLVQGGAVCAFVARRGGHGAPALVLAWAPIESSRTKQTAREVPGTSALREVPGTSPRVAAAAEQIADAVAAATGLRPRWLVCVDPTTLPRTGIGKIRRAALRARFEAGALDAGLAPLTRAWGLWRARWRPQTPAPAGSFAADAITAARVALLGAPAWLVDGLRGKGLDCDDGLLPNNQPAAQLVVAGAGLVSRQHDGVVPAVAADARATIEALLAVLATAMEPEAEASRPARLLPGRLLLVGALATAEARLRTADAARGALLQAAALESGGTALQLDLDADTSTEAGRGAVVEAVHDALRRDWRGEAIERWRDGVCEVRRLQPAGDATQVGRGGVAPAAVASDDTLRGARVVLLGGSGGLGTLLQTALDEAGASVLVLSRSATARSAGQRAERWQAVDVDLAESDAVEAAIAGWEREVGAASHLVWAATVGRPAALRHELRPELTASRAALWRARIDGADTVAALLARRPETRLLDLSTVHAAVPGHGLGVYAAAACHAGAMVEALAHGHAGPVGSLLCAAIRGVGLSRGGAGQQRAEALGLASMAPEAFVQIALTALRSPAGELWLGLDARGELTRARVDALRQAAPLVEAPLPHDRTQRPATNDAPAPATTASTTAVAADRATVATIAQIWATLLERDDLPHDRSFFELGGNSLLMARLQDGLERAFERTVPMAELFDRPTITDQARWLSPTRTP